jgi:hypothetical protein
VRFLAAERAWLANAFLEAAARPSRLSARTVVAAGTATFEAQSTCQKSNWIWILDFLGVGQIRLVFSQDATNKCPLRCFIGTATCLKTVPY